MPKRLVTFLRSIAQMPTTRNRASHSGAIGKIFGNSVGVVGPFESHYGLVASHVVWSKKVLGVSGPTPAARLRCSTKRGERLPPGLAAASNFITL